MVHVTSAVTVTKLALVCVVTILSMLKFQLDPKATCAAVNESAVKASDKTIVVLFVIDSIVVPLKVSRLAGK